MSCADGKKYTSAAVIVTVPLGILKKGNITFTPALPASFTAATTRLKAGTTNKLMVQFDRQILTDEQMKYIWFGIDRTPNPNAAAVRGKDCILRFACRLPFASACMCRRDKRCFRLRL